MGKITTNSDLAEMGVIEFPEEETETVEVTEKPKKSGRPKKS